MNSLWDRDTDILSEFLTIDELFHLSSVSSTFGFCSKRTPNTFRIRLEQSPATTHSGQGMSCFRHEVIKLDKREPK